MNKLSRDIFLKDPRVFGFIFLNLFSIYALISTGYARTPLQFFLTLGTGALVDYLFLRFYKKIRMFPTSGILGCYGIFLLADTPHLWIYPLLVTIAISSKHFLTSEKKHIFNPNNFGLTMGILFLSKYMTVINGRWGGYFWIESLIIILGVLFAANAGRLTLVLSFLTSFVLLAICRSYYLNVKLMWVFMPLTGPAFFLFSFYMLSDPKTTPVMNIEQIFFGILVALIDAVLRVNQNKYSAFLALFIVCGFYDFIKMLTMNYFQKTWKVFSHQQIRN
jgi:hypothetical protein